jgi:chitodextrinase
MASYPLWDSSVEYEPGATVSYSNFFYVANILNKDNAPASNPFWSCTGPSVWSADAFYPTGIVVTDGISFYASIISNSNNAPASSPTLWQLVGPAELKGIVGIGGMLLKLYGPPS